MKILSHVARMYENAADLFDLLVALAAAAVLAVLFVFAVLLPASPCHAADYVTIVDGKGNAYRCNVQTKACKYQGAYI